MPKISLIALLSVLLLAAGCLDPITSTNIAAPLGSLGSNNISQREGFGPLPATPAVAETNSVVRINTDLPSLQPYVTVLRLPPNGLDSVQFQNLTTALQMPVGLIGEQAKNLDFAFTWTNIDNEVWSYNSENRRLTYANAQNTPSEQLVDSWPSDEQIQDAVDAFMIGRGMDPLSYRNPMIQSKWKEFKRRVDAKEACISQSAINSFLQIKNAKIFLDSNPPNIYQTNCVNNQFPSRIPISFDLVTDERNIMNQNGQSEIGGGLVLNAATLKVEYGWLTLSASPARSEYPAISADQMRQDLLNGGLGGAVAGSVDINETFFAFIELPTNNEYGYKYLAPALVGSGVQNLNGAKIPYNIVVPLTK